MNLKEIKDMIHLMNENELIEIELERDGLKIRLKKDSAEGLQPQVITTQEGLKQGQKVETAKEEKKEQQLIEVNSPMVGTFYRASSVDSPPYVDIGSEIEPGQVICIIEAMKLMNEIKAEVKGRIKEALVENGAPVEFGQTLFRVEP